MKCPNCGADYSADELSCPYCGAENKVGIRRKQYREWKQKLLSGKEKEAVRRSMPEAVSRALFWVMIVSILLVFVTVFACAGIEAAYQKKQDQEAKKNQEAHIAFLERCLEEENYVPLEDYLLDYGLYEEIYEKYMQVSEWYQQVSRLRNYRRYLSELSPDSSYFEEDLERYVKQLLSCSQELLRFEKEPHSLYGEVKQEVRPVLEEYQAEARTTLSGTLHLTEEEMEAVTELRSYSEEAGEYVKIGMERVKQEYGWK